MTKFFSNIIENLNFPRDYYSACSFSNPSILAYRKHNQNCTLREKAFSRSLPVTFVYGALSNDNSYFSKTSLFIAQKNEKRFRKGNRFSKHEL